MRFEDYVFAKTVYEKNENVTSALKTKLKVDYNTPEIIAVAYDLQAGTYSIAADNQPEFYKSRAKEVSDFITSNVSDIESMTYTKITTPPYQSLRNTLLRLQDEELS